MCDGWYQHAQLRRREMRMGRLELFDAHGIARYRKECLDTAWDTNKIEKCISVHTAHGRDALLQGAFVLTHTRLSVTL